MKTVNKKVDKRNVPTRSDDVLVTQRMLSETKSELKSEITSVRLEVKALDKKVNSLEQKMESRFSEMDSKIETVISAVHRTNALVEEQNSRNRAVLDGYDQIYRRQEESEKRLKKLERA